METADRQGDQPFFIRGAQERTRSHGRDPGRACRPGLSRPRAMRAGALLPGPLNGNGRSPGRSAVFYSWCPGEDSNLHTLRHMDLNHARLPIPPPGRLQHITGKAPCVQHSLEQRGGIITDFPSTVAPNGFYFDKVSVLCTATPSSPPLCSRDIPSARLFSPDISVFSGNPL